MVTEIQYTNIKRVLDNLHDHPMLADLTLEQAVRHTIRFISKHGYNKLYQDKLSEIEIKDYRGALPCDIISIIQVKDKHTGICMRSMTDTFTNGMLMDNQNCWHTHKYEGSPTSHNRKELSFKTQGRVIYTSFPEGNIIISYKAIPIDEDGFPLLIDNETYLDALEAYIKKQVFTVKFDQQKISAGVLQNAQTDYAVAANILQSEMTLPSPSEMESLAAMWNTLIPNTRSFSRGFEDLGNREHLRKL